jgi:transcriptional accessory protein Tex/SPT6
VDLNKCIAFDHLGSPLQFVSGFGPRKANFFLNYFRKEIREGVQSKQELKKLLPPNLLYNSFAFLRINEDLNPSTLEPNKFQGTDFLRVHFQEQEILEIII